MNATPMMSFDHKKKTLAATLCDLQQGAGAELVERYLNSSRLPLAHAGDTLTGRDRGTGRVSMRTCRQSRRKKFGESCLRSGTVGVVPEVLRSVSTGPSCQQRYAQVD